MHIERYLAATVRWMPNRIKSAVLGKRSAPSRLATAIHSILNRLPVEPYPVLDCSGPLAGFRMRVDWKNHRSFAYGNWEPEVVDVISRCVSTGMTALDLGAQSGFYSLLLSRLVGPSGTVVAFEPLPANYRVLLENIELNGLNNITARPEAVTEAPGTMEFEVPGSDSNLIAGPLLPDDARPMVLVPTISLDALAREIGPRIDFIKIDVEGAENQVLRGAASVLNSCRPTMLIELHNMDGKSRTHDVVTELIEVGYRIEWLGELSWTSHILARWDSEAPEKR